jgi:hypothetical protein
LDVLSSRFSSVRTAFYFGIYFLEGRVSIATAAFICFHPLSSFHFLLIPSSIFFFCDARATLRDRRPHTPPVHTSCFSPILGRIPPDFHGPSS